MSLSEASEVGAPVSTEKPEPLSRWQITSKTHKQVQHLRQLIYGNWYTAVTYTFAELGLADCLFQEPKSGTALAEETGTDSNMLRRYLRCCVELGLIKPKKGTDNCYKLTELGAFLATDHPMSQRAAARLQGAPYRYEPWGKLVDVLKGEDRRNISPAFENGTLDYLADKPELLEVFHRAMTDLSAGENEPIAEAFNFKPFSRVMDVGGGEGSFLDAMLRLNPHLEGTLLELEEPSYKDEQPRWHFQRGSFFEGVPAGADVYTIKNVIHNWPEAKALRLLENLRDALAQEDACTTPVYDRRLLVIEYVVPEGDTASIGKWLDLNFMILIDGAERTLEEYRALGARAGLELRDAHPTTMGRHILEFSLAGVSLQSASEDWA